jgi:hypothetical protein
MTQFGRMFDARGLQALENVLTQSEHGHWWKDLLTLWRPSGQPTEDYGLRLAVRNGYMNFYRCGQSVARVSLNRRRQPILSVHAKYVLPKGDRNTVIGQEYITLTTTSLVRRGEHAPLPYEGIETLKGWIRSVDEEYGGDEKGLVDELLSVPGNDGVIDLEMGLPAWAENSAAQRMDLVSIDRVRGQLTVFFGEVKRVTDKRLRCRAPLKQDEMPEVLKQLSDYRKYLAIPRHQTLIGEQYSNAAGLMKRLRGMADAIGPTRNLGRSILDAAKGEPLAVAELARLIVMNGNGANQRAWTEHRAKLETEKERVPMMVLAAPAALNLGAWY